jgi:MFS family permease
MGGKVPATSNATRARPEPEPAARRRPWPAALAWSLYALVLLLFATFPVLDRLARHAGRPDLALLAPFVAAPSLAAFTASTVGAVLASRRPRHPVGWLLLILGLCMAIGGVIAGYLPYTVIIRPGALPGAGLLARIYAPLTDLALAALGLVLLLTPTGSAPSARWRRWGVAAAAMAVLAVAATVAPGSLDARALAVEGPVGPRAFGGALAVLNQLALAMAILIILGGAASLVTRFRRAHGVERQQLRWVALAAALTGAAMLATAVLVAVGDLAVAAVFQPARRRVQAAVDRRFNRRHDAGRIIEAFGARLRDQVDLDVLHGELLAVVDQTMQPTQAWLWQRPPPERAGR